MPLVWCWPGGSVWVPVYVAVSNSCCPLLSHFEYTPFHVTYSWPLCANMTSSIEPEAHNVLQQRTTESWLQLTCIKNLVQTGHVDLAICSWTNTQTNTQRRQSQQDSNIVSHIFHPTAGTSGQSAGTHRHNYSNWKHQRNSFLFQHLPIASKGGMSSPSWARVTPNSILLRSLLCCSAWFFCLWLCVSGLKKQWPVFDYSLCLVLKTKNEEMCCYKYVYSPKKGRKQ